MDPVARVALALAALAPLGSGRDEVTLPAVHDNTLYEDPSGSLSNGYGAHFFAGRTGQATGTDVRRALLQFDPAGAIPPGATITAVRLRLHMSMSPTGDRLVSTHRCLAEWGEKSSDAPSGEGSGAPAAPGDATWIHTFFASAFWLAAGGDFSASSSASALIGGPGYYEWSGPGLVADLQAWLDDPVSNHGWTLIGDELGTTTAKRFDSREHPTAARRPSLIVSFVAPITVYCFGSGCPCGNDASAAGCGNGSFADGCELSGHGLPSVASDTLALRVARSSPGELGLFFQGDLAIGGGAGAPFGDGLRCAGSGVVRLEMQVADLQGNASSTIPIGASAGISPGDLERYQWWYRDAPPSPCGSGFNLSNGLEILWRP